MALLVAKRQYLLELATGSFARRVEFCLPMARQAPPISTLHFDHLVRDPVGSFGLLSDVIGYLAAEGAPIRVEPRDSRQGDHDNPVGATRDPSWTELHWNPLIAFSPLAGRRRGRTVAIHPSSGVQRSDVTYLASVLGWRLQRVTDSPIPMPSPDPRRGKFAPTGSPKADAVLGMARNHLPISLWEASDRVIDAADALASRYALATLVAGGDYANDDRLNAFAAAAQLQGTTIVGCQHGNLYGQIECNPAEELEFELADHFLSWGWTGKSNVTASFGARVNRKSVSRLRVLQARRAREGRSEAARRSQGRDPEAPRLLVIAGGPDPLLPLAFTGMTPARGDTYFTDVLEVLNALQSAPHDGSLVRWGTTFQAANGFKLANLHLPARFSSAPRDGDLVAQARDFDLAIVAYQGTPFEELVSANFPVLMLLDPDYVPTARMQKVMDPLVGAGVLHRSVDSLASHTRSILRDVSGYWTRADVQEAVANFRREFAANPGAHSKALRRLAKDIKAIPSSIRTS